jgi:hypothetical protein
LLSPFHTTRKSALRVLTIFEGLVFTLFEAHFPFRFPHGVREDGKRKWERRQALRRMRPAVVVDQATVVNR